MNDGTNNDDELLADAGTYKARSATARFKQQMSYGIGAAMVFGLVGALSKGLLDMAGAAFAVGGGGLAAAALPIAGLAALGVAGVVCLYLSAKFLSENTYLDQAMAAKQISDARAKAKEPAPALASPVTAPTSQTFPDRDQASEQPGKWAERVSPAAIATEAAWGDKVRAGQAAETAATLH